MPGGGGAIGGAAGCGGGGIGGGGGCGGGGGGGGFAYGASGGVNSSYTPGGACGGASPLTCKQNVIVAVVGTTFFLVVTGLVIGLPLGILIPSVRNGNRGAAPPIKIPVFFSPGDSRIVSFSSFFCDEVTLVDKSRRTEATLYLITDTPPLTDQNNFTINSSLTLTGGFFNYWNYYLYPGSKFSTTVRIRSNSDRGTVYLFKGRSSFQRWINNPVASMNEPIATLSISCSHFSNHQLSFIVRNEDEYYFVYYNSPGQCSLTRSVFRLDVTISASRFQYSTEDLTTAASCFVMEGECSLNVPLDLNYRALIVTDIPDDPDWEENVDVTLHCSSNREWAYAVVILVPILVIVGVCIAPLLYACNKIRRWQPSQRSETADSGVQLLRITPIAPLRYNTRSTRQHPATDKTDEQNLTAIPPPSYGVLFANPEKNEDNPLP